MYFFLVFSALSYVQSVNADLESRIAAYKDRSATLHNKWHTNVASTQTTLQQETQSTQTPAKLLYVNIHAEQ